MPTINFKRRVLLAAAVATIGATVVACSSSKKSTSVNATVAATTATGATATSAPAATAAAATTGLSGTWNGNYSGNYSGTFVLTWTQTGSQLSGQIQISKPQSTLPINGELVGGSIKFGTVGSLAIKYTGSVHGSSMSGNWSIVTPQGKSLGGGSWAANKD
jgi:hypothetical protein